MNYVTPVAFAVAVAACACSDGAPEVVESTQEANPSRTLVATVEVVHNGLGLGAGALFDEIHVSEMSHRPFEHGDPDGSVAFYSESTGARGRTPSVEWLSDNQLRIAIDPAVKPGRRRDNVAGVSIEYAVRPKGS